MVVLVLATSVAAVTPTASRADDARDTVERIHTRGRYPNDLLVAPEGDGPRRNGRPVPIFGDRAAPNPLPDPPENVDLPDFGLPFLRGLSWVGYAALALCIAALVALLVWLLARLRRLPPDETETATKPRTDVGAESLDPLLALPTLSHAELAAQGRFREAVHALLVESLLATGWAPEGRGRGLTAREIVLRYERPAPPREPLVELLRTVERVWFGGREATRETYEIALRLHQRFVVPPDLGPSAVKTS